MSQCDDILAFLSDGREHEMRDVHRAVGFCRLNSRVAELRGRGHDIECRKQAGEYHYRLVAPLTDAVAGRGAADHAAPAAAWSGADPLSRQEPTPLQLTLAVS